MKGAIRLLLFHLRGMACTLTSGRALREEPKREKNLKGAERSDDRAERGHECDLPRPCQRKGYGQMGNVDILIASLSRRGGPTW